MFEGVAAVVEKNRVVESDEGRVGKLKFVVDRLRLIVGSTGDRDSEYVPVPVNEVLPLLPVAIVTAVLMLVATPGTRFVVAGFSVREANTRWAAGAAQGIASTAASAATFRREGISGFIVWCQK